jgi:hypothetical protein
MTAILNSVYCLLAEMWTLCVYSKAVNDSTMHSGSMRAWCTFPSPPQETRKGGRWDHWTVVPHHICKKTFTLLYRQTQKMKKKNMASDGESIDWFDCPLFGEHSFNNKNCCSSKVAVPADILDLMNESLSKMDLTCLCYVAPFQYAPFFWWGWISCSTVCLQSNNWVLTAANSHSMINAKLSLSQLVFNSFDPFDSINFNLNRILWLGRHGMLIDLKSFSWIVLVLLVGVLFPILIRARIWNTGILREHGCIWWYNGKFQACFVSGFVSEQKLSRFLLHIVSIILTSGNWTSFKIWTEPR